MAERVGFPAALILKDIYQPARKITASMGKVKFKTVADPVAVFQVLEYAWADRAGILRLYRSRVSGTIRAVTQDGPTPMHRSNFPRMYKNPTVL
jgi:hypothetical protein